VATGLVAAVGAVALLVGAGAGARPDGFASHSSADALGPVERPDIRVDLAALPKIELGSTKEFATAITEQDARDVVRDFVADLEITARALRTRDPALAATAGDEQWLERVERAIARAHKTDRVTVSTYQFDSLTVAVLKLRAAQALPEIDVRVRGTVRHATYEGGSDGPVDVAVEPHTRVYVVEAIGGHYLVTNDRAR
jgi:hypothetical protein